MVATNLAVTIEFEAYNESSGEDEQWCHTITASITDTKTNTRAAHGVAYLLDRYTMALNDMDPEEIAELSASGEALFDDKELFWDDICMETFVLFHEVVVEPEYRRQGLGKKLVTAIQDKVREHGGGGQPYNLAAPGYLEVEVSREIARENAEDDKGKILAIRGRHIDAAVAFWTACGFEKLEKSHFFLYAE